MRASFVGSTRTYGARRVWRDVLADGIDCGLHRIERLMKAQEVGAKTADVCRRHGISAATFYKFKAKYGGMDVSDARRLKAVEDENAR